MSKNKTIVSFIIFLLICVNTNNIFAQCRIENKYFQAGETLEYDLHFKWGLISKKSGVATLKTINTRYNNQNALKVSLTSSSKGSARKIFLLDDTLSCILTPDLVPLAFYKDAHEDDDYTKERLTYSYPGNGKTTLKAIRYKNGNFKFDETIHTNNCTYDMLSVVMYARTLDYDKMRKGNKKNVDFISGRKKLSMIIVHEGTEKLKVNDGITYNCIKLSLKISDDAFESEEEAMKVYITNDLNRMPIRIDSKLKIGNARVILKSFKGNKYPVNIAK